ncbi:MAG TPA: TetR family transcriptional regulator [Amycolatopsis sp.]|nr:TetR family transcriptional regulator [Amycolatopsis sp.]
MAAQARRPTRARRRRARGSITPEEVIRGAFEVCAAETVDGLSMPRLAQHLDVGVTSIYWYFKSRDDLLDALTEEAFRRFYAQMPPLEGRQWDEVLIEFFRNFRSILIKDDVLCDLFVMRGGHYTDGTLQISWERIEEIMEILLDAGFSEESATYAYSTLSVYTRGCIVIDRITRRGGVDTSINIPPRLGSATSGLPREVQMRSWAMSSDDNFAFGLENNIRGLRELLATERKRTRAS